MKCITLPYGTAGWNEKTRILHGLFTSRPAPPYLYNDVLVIVPSSRMKRAYARLVLDIAETRFGSPAIVPPEVATFHQLLQRFAGMASAPALIDENSRLIALEGIVKELIMGNAAFGRTPDLLAPSLSAAVADMIEQLGTAGVPPAKLASAVVNSDLASKPQVRLLIDAYERYEEMLQEKRLQDPASQLGMLAEKFDPSWLSPFTTIVIDGIHDPGPLGTFLLRKIASLDNCMVLIEAPSAKAVRTSGEHHPLRLVRELVTGLDLRLPEDPASTSPEQVLSEMLFSDRAFDESAKLAPAPGDFPVSLDLLSAVNMREEVSLIAREVKRTLREGAEPDSVLVAFPAIDEYGPLVEEIFTDFGIPYNRALGRQLSTSAPATSLVALLQTVQEEYSGPSLVRAVSSPFLKFSEEPRFAPALDRLMRQEQIVDRKEQWLSALKRVPPEEQAMLLPQVQDLFSSLEPFRTTTSQDLAAWMDQLQQLIVWSGLEDRVNRIKGPLAMNVQAYRKLVETAASLNRAGRLFPRYRYSFSEWLFLLKKTFMRTRYQVPPDDEGGVQVLGLEESAGHAWQEIHLGGLTDTAFPQRLSQNIFLPESLLETLGVRTLAKARLTAAHHFYRLLFSAPRITMTWPESVGDKTVVRSPFLEELRPLELAGLMNRKRRETTGLQFSLKVQDSCSVAELAKALALAGTAASPDLSSFSGLEGISGILSAVADRPAAAAAPAPEGLRHFSVTELDDYLRCPYQYFVRRRLRLLTPEEVSEDLSAADRGSRIHGILKDFYEHWQGPVTAENRNAAQDLLRELADKVFRREADTYRNKLLRDQFLRSMVPRFLDAEIAVFEQGFRPAYLEWTIENYSLQLSDGTAAEVHAKIDRVDVNDQGDFIIVDYKTGAYDDSRKGVDQTIFQLPVYAVIAGSQPAGTGPLLKRPIGLAYYDLGNRNGGPARDVVLFDKDVRDDHPANKPQASPKSAAEFAEILRLSMDKARIAAEGIIANAFPTTPVTTDRCRNCTFDALCRIDRDE